MVKIAVLLTGRLYSKQINKDNIGIKNDIYNKSINSIKLLGDDITIFCSLNKSIEINEYTDKFCKDFNITSQQINIEDTQEPSELYKYRKAPASNYHSVYSMFYHNKRSFELLEQYKNKYNIDFDIIIKFRGDLNSNSLISLNHKLDNLTVYIPSGFDYGGINDQIAVGNFETMKIYCSCIDKISNYCRNKIIFHPETILKYHLDKNNVKIVRFKYNYNIIK